MNETIISGRVNQKALEDSYKEACKDQQFKRLIKTIEVENINKSSEFLKTNLLTKAEVKKAIEGAICQIDANMEYFKNKFPSSATKQNKYEIIENIEIQTEENFETESIQKMDTSLCCVPKPEILQMFLLQEYLLILILVKLQTIWELVGIFITQIDIVSVDLDVLPYDWVLYEGTKDEKRGRSAYLQSIKVVQDVDRFASRFAEEEYPEE